MARIKVEGSPTILTKFSRPRHFVLKVLLKGFELYVTKKLLWTNLFYERVAQIDRTTNVQIRCRRFWACGRLWRAKTPQKTLFDTWHPFLASRGLQDIKTCTLTGLAYLEHCELNFVPRQLRLIVDILGLRIFFKLILLYQDKIRIRSNLVPRGSTLR